jgi:hypothetical protein
VRDEEKRSAEKRSGGKRKRSGSGRERGKRK